MPPYIRHQNLLPAFIGCLVTGSLLNQRCLAKPVNTTKPFNDVVVGG
jgi:hypothetical protein